MERDDFEGTQAVFKRVYEIERHGPTRTRAGARTKSSWTSGSSSTCSPCAIPTASPAPARRRRPGPRQPVLVSAAQRGEHPAARPRAAARAPTTTTIPFDAGRHDGRADGNEWIVVKPTEPRVRIIARRPARRAGERARGRYALKRDARLEAEIGERDQVVDRTATRREGGPRRARLRAPESPGRYRVRIDGDARRRPGTATASSSSCGASSSGAQGRREREERDRREVRGGGGDHEHVEDLVVAEDGRARVRALGRVDDRAGHVEGAAAGDQDPGGEPGLGDDRRKADRADHPDGDVDDRRDPLGRLDPDELDDRAGDGAGPDRDQQRGRQRAVHDQQRERRDRAGDEEEDHRVVEAAHPAAGAGRFQSTR